MKTAAKAKYRRILLKLSGEALGGEKGMGIATAGLIIGAAHLALIVLLIIGVLFLVFVLGIGVLFLNPR